MSKYIDADKKLTITVYDDEHEENIDRYMTIEEIMDTYTSEGCPTTADVVEVVRCKDCKFRKIEFGWNGKKYKMCANTDYPTDDDAYCSYAERREDAEIH